ncbi:cysteine rich repeat-containing protein [Roseiarcus sp.]|uniref:cysteine rich repeat-containing protein n=1 Tax=Roseiarcus sp. TaxID=1969460 RepID=UPI003C4AD6BD
MPIGKLAVAALSAFALLALSNIASAQMADLTKYCKADAERLCPGTEPGGGRIVKCLKAHKMEVSIGCGKAIQHIKAEMGK